MKKYVNPEILKNTAIPHALLTVLGTYGIIYLLGWMGIAKASFTILGIFAGAILWFLLDWTGRDLSGLSDRKSRGRRVLFAEAVAFMLALSLLFGYQLQMNGMTECGFLGKGVLILRALCLSIAFFPLANYFFGCLEKTDSVSLGKGKSWRPAAVFLVSAAIIFVCLIPVWLAFYPIIMSYDFHRQVNEAYRGFEHFWPYQPIAHTWVIWVFMQLGNALGSLETGFSYMALLHILLYSLVMGYACSMIYRILRRKWAVVAAVLFLGLFPFNTVLVVCTSKDVIFTVLFVLFFLLLGELLLFTKWGGQKVHILSKKNVISLLLVLEGCLMAQFRNNAFYAVAVFMVLLLILVPIKEKLRFFLLCVLLIGGCKLTGSVIKGAIGTEMTGPKVEMYSVPIQQFARVGYYHGETLAPETASRLESFVPRIKWQDYYAPLADSVKGRVVEASFENFSNVYPFWLELAKQYPNEFLDAFLELTRGYWFLDDTSWSENLGSTPELRHGAIFTYNSSELMDTGESIADESKLPWLEDFLVKVVSTNEFYNWPIISIIFRSAFYPWCLFLITLAYLYKRQYMQLKLSLLIWMYFGTLLLGPVVQMRYIFPVMVLVPMLLALLFYKEQTWQDNEILEERKNV